MKFRTHRGSLAESMETVVDLPDRAALISHVNAEYRSTLDIMDRGDFTDDEIEVAPYGFDKRIGWDTYLVTARGFGPLGMADGPCPRLDA